MDYIGYVDEISRFCVAGWVADRDAWGLSQTVEIFIKGQARNFCKADDFRGHLDELHPDATGRYAFRFYFPTPLSMFETHEVTVRVKDSDYRLIQQRPIIQAIATDPNTSSYRPGGPILLSTTGRTGSTAVMAVLAQHPGIVVAGTRPYEVELGCYYAYALRTLTADGDHYKSLQTDTITSTANRYNIGFNPYFKAGHADVFKDPTALEGFMQRRLPLRLAGVFRDIILDYYEEVAKDQGTAYPIYFAEKSLPEIDARHGIRYMFPNLKEIVLIRDMRDVICSSTSSNGMSFDAALAANVTAARQLLAIDAERNANTMFLRYEDFVLDSERTIDALFRFLGLSPIRSDERGMNELFATHATSASPAASIHRWKKGLSPEQQTKCAVFNPFFKHFGYDIQT
jgi:hypothetical protein